MSEMHVHTSTEFQGHTRARTNRIPSLAERMDCGQATIDPMMMCPR